MFSYSTRVAEINSISHQDVLLSASRFLSSFDDIPFNIRGSFFSDFTECIFYGRPVTALLVFRMKVSSGQLLRLDYSHLTCPTFSIEHRLLCVAYMMLSLIMKEGREG